MPDVGDVDDVRMCGLSLDIRASTRTHGEKGSPAAVAAAWGVGGGRRQSRVAVIVSPSGSASTRMERSA